MPAKLFKTLEEHWEIKDCGYTTPCWVWRGQINAKGYGEYEKQYKKYKAHAFVYCWFGGVIPEGMVPDHLCRNRGCVNPAHIEPVTKAENVRRGDAAKINMEVAREIRRMKRLGNTAAAIGRQLGVPYTTVIDVTNNRSWREETAEDATKT
jgi:hypothetical protein